MKCPRCGNELKDGMLFCEHCGEEIRIVQDFEPEMEMNMETFSTETFSVEEDFPWMKFCPTGWNPRGPRMPEVP